MKGLIPGDGGCKTLIEHVLRCVACERKYGPHADAYGPRGMVPRNGQKREGTDAHDPR
jgi:hypothetical protein